MRQADSLEDLERRRAPLSPVSEVTRALAARLGGSASDWQMAWGIASGLSELYLQELARQLRHEGWL